MSNFRLQNKTAAARGKRDNNDQQCRRCLSTLHFNKKKTQPVKIKAVQINMRVIFHDNDILDDSHQVCSVNL